MDDPRKDHADPKRSPKKNCPQQLLTHIVPTEDVENTNDTNQWGDLWFTNQPQTAPRGMKRMSQEDQRYWRATIHWSTQPQGEQNDMKKSSYGVDWL